MPKHVFTQQERSRGGRTRSKQPDFVDACRKGFETTFERHPFFARHHLKMKIRHAYPNGRVNTYDGKI